MPLQTPSGSLQLEGQGQRGSAQRFAFSGVASAAPERVEALSNLLEYRGTARRRASPSSPLVPSEVSPMPKATVSALRFGSFYSQYVQCLQATHPFGRKFNDRRQRHLALRSQNPSL